MVIRLTTTKQKPWVHRINQPTHDQFQVKTLLQIIQ